MNGRRPKVTVDDPYRGCFALSVVGALGCIGLLVGLAYVVSLIIRWAGW